MKTIDYRLELRNLLKRAIRGIKLRGMFFGYGSDRVHDYIKRQRKKINWLEMDASEEGQKIYSRENLDEDAKLFGLEVRADMARMGIPV